MTQIFLCLRSSLLFVRAQKKGNKDDTEKEVKEKRVIDDKNRHKPYGKTAWVPMDDVYIMRYYPRTIYDAADAIDMLKNFQVLDFTPHKQPVYIDLRLDMKLEKKVMATTLLLCSLYVLCEQNSRLGHLECLYIILVILSLLGRKQQRERNELRLQLHGQHFKVWFLLEIKWFV